MATKPDDQQNDEPQPGNDDEASDMFETDISESADDETTVRQAEVNKDDLSEVKKDNP